MLPKVYKNIFTIWNKPNINQTGRQNVLFYLFFVVFAKNKISLKYFFQILNGTIKFLLQSIALK